jgi:hypothetical protein
MNQKTQNVYLKIMRLSAVCVKAGPANSPIALHFSTLPFVKDAILRLLFGFARALTFIIGDSLRKPVAIKVI